MAQLRLMANASADASAELEPGPALPAVEPTVEATFSAPGSVGIEFAYPFIESIDPEGVAAAVPGLRRGLMLREVITPAGRVENAHRLGEQDGMCVRRRP
jgi:hypothetical protein